MVRTSSSSIAGCSAPRAVHLRETWGRARMDEAQAWLEYCNGTGNTHWANLRRKHGHAEPYRVKYWAWATRWYGAWQVGNLGAEDYVKKARAFAMVMKRTDPSIALVSCGQNGWSPWDETVLEGSPRWWTSTASTSIPGHSDYYVNVFQPTRPSGPIRICERSIERVRYNQRLAHPIYIAYDEWNVWYRTRSHEDRVAGVQEQYNLGDALAVATYLKHLHPLLPDRPDRQPAQLVNAIAPIFTSRRACSCRPSTTPAAVRGAHPECPRRAGLASATTCLPSQEEAGFGRRFQIADLGPFKFLDAAATCDPKGGQVMLAVVNRDRDGRTPATVQLTAGVSSGVQVSR